MSLEDRVDDIESNLEDKISRLEYRIDELEAGLEQTDYTMDDMQKDLIIFRAKSAGEIERIKKILALATSPDPENLEKFKQLREAYEKYEFTKKLVLGNDVTED